MSFELTKAEENKIALMSRTELSEMIRPLKQEILLLETFVSGTLDKSPENTGLQEGEKLVLKREESLFSEFQTGVYTEKGDRLGIIPEKDSVIPARLLDAGKLLTAEVSGIRKKHNMKVVEIRICLVDY